MTVIRIAFAAAALASFTAGAADAASCDGWYEMRARRFDGAAPAAPVEWKIGDFSAEASCKGITDDHCRAKATAALFLCFHAHYEQRGAGTRPERCTKVDGYRIDDLNLSLGEAVCCSKKARGHRNVEVTLFGRVDGAANCSVWSPSGVRNFWKPEPRAEIVASDYAIDCADIRAKLCPKYAKGD